MSAKAIKYKDRKNSEVKLALRTLSKIVQGDSSYNVSVKFTRSKHANYDLMRKNDKSFSSRRLKKITQLFSYTNVEQNLKWCIYNHNSRNVHQFLSTKNVIGGWQKCSWVKIARI